MLNVVKQEAHPIQVAINFVRPPEILSVLEYVVVFNMRHHLHHNKPNKNRSDEGFSFIELILYMGIMSLVLGSIVNFTWNTILLRERSQTQIRVLYTVRHASERISYEIRNAASVSAISSSSITLAMADPARNPTIIDLSDNKVRIRWGTSGTCSSLDPSPTQCYLTPDDVSISTLTFTNLSSPPQTGNIAFQVTAQIYGDRKEWQESTTINSIAEVRSQQ